VTFRAIILGLLGAILIAAGGYINDQVFRLNQVVGSQFPIVVFGPLMLAVLAVNPLLGLVKRSWRLRGAELAVVIMLSFAGCSIPGSGMMRFFTRVLNSSLVYSQNELTWKKTGVLSYVPPTMMPAGAKYNERAADGFLYGRGIPGQPIGLSDVPWDLWQQPLITWLPIIVLLAVSAICMAMIVHRQWSAHERLRYPLAEFAKTVLDSASDGSILRNRIFWLGLGVILAIRIVNGVQTYFPDSIEIPLSLDLWPLAEKWKDLNIVPWRWAMLKPTLYPIALAFAFFLASDVSLSISLAQPLSALVVMFFFQMGISFESDSFRGGILDWQKFGSCVAIAMMIAYTGRRYYWQVFSSGVLLRPSADRVEGCAVWAFRVLLLCLTAVTVMLIQLGLDWPMAIAMTLMIIVAYVVMARLNAEAGLILAGVSWQPFGVMLAMMGSTAMGPQCMMIVALWSAMITFDTRENLTPFMVNGLKVCDDQNVQPRRMGLPAAIAFIAAIAVAVPVVLWADYNFGTAGGEVWASTDAPKTPFNAVSTELTKLTLGSRMEEATSLSPLGRFAHMEPRAPFLWATGIGFVGVILFGVARLRFPWWPLHPVMFLLFSSWPGSEFGFSFLLGWMIKMAVTKFGGPSAYRSTKMLMIGVIAGDLLAGLGLLAAGAAYYAVTNAQPPLYRILPGG
jgi:hypothetical protein